MKGWYREYQQRLDLPAGYADRKPKFSREQKKAAIEHYLAHDRYIAATIRALGYLLYGSGHAHGITLQGENLVDFERDALYREAGRQLVTGAEASASG